MIVGSEVWVLSHPLREYLGYQDTRHSTVNLYLAFGAECTIQFTGPDLKPQLRSSIFLLGCSHYLLTQLIYLYFYELEQAWSWTDSKDSTVTTVLALV